MDDRGKPGGLAGLRVLSLESRRAPEMAKLIENYGGRAIVAPSMREVPLESNTEALAFARIARREWIRHGDFSHRRRHESACACGRDNLSAGAIRRGAAANHRGGARAEARGRAKGIRSAGDDCCAGAKHVAGFVAHARRKSRSQPR